MLSNFSQRAEERCEDTPQIREEGPTHLQRSEPADEAERPVETDVEQRKQLDARSAPLTWDSRGRARELGGSATNRFARFLLPADKTITISIIAGPSRGQALRLSKPLVSVGRIGGGADFELNDPEASVLHCAIGVTPDMVRLCDLDSANGTFVNDELVSSASLGHLSEVRVGSSLLLITIIPSRPVTIE